MGDWSVQTWMQMLSHTLLAQWIHQTSKLPVFFYPTFSWNHTIEIESYHVMSLSNNQRSYTDHLILWDLNFEGEGGVDWIWLHTTAYGLTREHLDVWTMIMSRLALVRHRPVPRDWKKMLNMMGKWLELVKWQLYTNVTLKALRWHVSGYLGADLCLTVQKSLPQLTIHPNPTNKTW